MPTPPPLPRHWLRAFMAIWAALIIGAMYARGQTVALDQPVTGRLRFHAIPVAMSVLYHGRRHDYTAYRSLALGFQERPQAIPTSEDSIETRLAWAATYTPPKDDATHYWAADDRGWADYVIGAFALFGPHVKSLYAFYFVVLGASVLLFVLDFGWHPAGSALLIFTLAAVYTCLSVIPLGRLEGPSLYEPRLTELLAFVATVHLGLAASLDDRWPGVRVAIVAAQAGFLAACYHMRSSVGWEAGFVMLAGTLVWTRRVWRARRMTAAGGERSLVFTPPWPAVCVAAALAGVAAYRHQTYNPRYFQDLGDRTVWHNALMGFGSNGHLNGRYNLRMNDQVIVDDVIAYMRRTDNPRLTPEFLAQADYAMSSLGGYHAFDWATYEKAARDFYWHIWRIDTRHAIHCYLVDKPRQIRSGLLTAWQPDPTGSRDTNGLYFRPLAAANLLMIAPGLLLVSASQTRFWPGLAGSLVLLAFSTLPGLMFYPVVETTIGVFAATALASYVALATALQAVSGAVRTNRSRRAQISKHHAQTGT